MASSSKGPEQRVHNWEQEVDRMSAMAAEALAKAKSTGFQALEGLMARQDAARERMRGVGSASGDAWHELKQGLESAWSDLHGAVQSAITKFQERQSQAQSTGAKTASAKSSENHTRSKPAKKKSAKKKSASQAKRSSTASTRRHSAKRAKRSS